MFSDPPPPQAFFRSDILAKTSDNLLYLLVDPRMGPVAHSEQYIFYPDPGHVPQTKVSGNLDLSLCDRVSYFFFCSISVSFKNVNQDPLLVCYL